MYIRDTFKATLLEHASGISDENFQQLWIKVQVRHCNSIFICTVYRPPGTSLAFSDSLSRSLLDILLHGNDIIIVSDSSSAIAAVNQDLRDISKWCAKNSLLINPEKTKLVVVGSAQLIKRLPHISLSLLGKTISPVSVAKDLGVYIDQYLTYDVHVTKTVSSCMNQLVQIGRIKHLLDKKTLLLLINSFVFSKLFYCSPVWGNTSKRNLHKRQLVQNFAATVVLGLKKFDHIS